MRFIPLGHVIFDPENNRRYTLNDTEQIQLEH